MSKHEIQLDYDEAKQRANELDALADRVNTLSKNKMGDVIDTTGSGWTGENGVFMNKKNQEFQEELDSLEKKLRNMASTIRFIAKTTYEAEMEAIRIAETIQNGARTLYENGKEVINHIF